VLVYLGFVTLVTVLLSSAILAAFGVTLAGSDGRSWLEEFWQSLLRVIDPGTMAADVGWGQRVLALLITVFGILIAGTLIGIIANGVEERVEAMRRGRSTVLESGHIVILGGTARLSIVVRQLALAGRGGRANTMVVLAEGEPAELSREVRDQVPDLHGSRVVFRAGDPGRLADLDMVALHEARAVIALSDRDGRGDAGVVRAVLAAGARLGSFDRRPIIAELHDPKAAEDLGRATGGAVHTVAPTQSVARITAFALREPGLNQVVEELLDFRGSDVHIHELGELTGRSFADTVFAFDGARPIGRIANDGTVEVNPEPETRFEAGDRLILIAQDGRVPPMAPSAAPAVAPASSTSAPRLRARSAEEHLLIIGWNTLGAQLVEQLEQITTPGSSAEIVYDPALIQREDVEVTGHGALDVTLTPIRGVTWPLDDQIRTSRTTSIMILGYRRRLTDEEADSRTLLTLTSLGRDLADRSGDVPRLIVELVNGENVELARLTGAADYVVSDTLATRLIAQLALQPERRAVLLSLYATDGPSLHLVSAADLGLGGERRTSEILATAYSHGLLAIGWRREDELVLNPGNDQRVHLDDGARIVVIG
jgi:Trk K+ transport system NAD-binding subunit